jgi:sporulation protein YlmC with PRC-barrel domain
MILVGSALKGFAVAAKDGKIGTVKDFLFDDRTWKIRWMVVDTGGWLTGRKVLVHPSAIGHPDYRHEELAVNLSKKVIEDSPGILSDAPVSQQMQTNLYGYYGWDPFWGGANYFGSYPYAMGAAFDPPPYGGDTGLLQEERRGAYQDDGDRELRSTTEIVGYHIQAKDGPIGHVENLLVDDATWDIRYLIIDTKNWWPGQHVLISPYAVKGISWPDRDVTVDVTRDQVKASPGWDPLAMVDTDYGRRLHSHYEWPGYGW